MSALIECPAAGPLDVPGRHPLSKRDANVMPRIVYLPVTLPPEGPAVGNSCCAAASYVLMRHLDRPAQGQLAEAEVEAEVNIGLTVPGNIGT